MRPQPAVGRVCRRRVRIGRGAGSARRRVRLLRLWRWRRCSTHTSGAAVSSAVRGRPRFGVRVLLGAMPGRRHELVEDARGRLSVAGPCGQGARWLMVPFPVVAGLGRPAVGVKVERPAGRTTLAPARTAVGSAARGRAGAWSGHGWSLVWGSWARAVGVMVHAGALAYLGARTVWWVRRRDDRWGAPRARGVWPLNLLRAGQALGQVPGVGGRRPSGAGHTGISWLGRTRHRFPHGVRVLGGGDRGEGVLAEGAQAVVAAAGELAGDRQDGALIAEPGGGPLVVGVVG